MALSPLVSGPRYLAVAAVLLGVVVATGAGLRLTRLPRTAVIAAQLVVAVELIVIGFTDEVVPTPTAYDTVAARLADFGALAQQYAAPLPRDDDTTMAFAIIVLGVGMVIDLVGVTLRRVPVLGLLFLLVYMVPVAHLGGDVSLFWFLPGAVGFVFMLAADESERLTHWGRQIRTANAVWQQGDPEVDDSGLTRSRLRIGFGAVAIAAVLPLLLPSVDPRILFDGGSGSGSGPGSGPVRVDDPSLDMRRNLAEASDDVLVRVSGPDEPAYFRLAALDDFTGEVWEVGERREESAVSTDDRLPLPLGGSSVSIERVTYEVELTEDLDTTWLPTVYAPRQIDIDTPWLVDPVNLDVRADSDEDLAGATYRLLAGIPTPTLAQLQSAGEPTRDMASFLRLPPDMPPIIEQTALSATSGKSTRIDQALALQAWFRNDGDYTYSLEQVDGDRNRTGLDAVEAFLEERVGYCEQYASAMALMARQLGIPSRVVVGFLRPEATAQGVWEFRGQDMHAWPELFFEGVGWVRFEPTPRSVSREAPPYTDIDTSTAGPSSGREPETEKPTRDPLAERSSAVDAGAGGARDDSGPWGTALPVLGGLIVIALLLSGPRLMREARTRRRWRRALQPQDVAEAAWTELRDCAVDLRVGWVEDATPRHAGRSLREHLGHGATPEVVKALNEVVLAVERSRYARSVAGATDLRPAVERIREALAAQRSTGQQRLARWLPASLWRSVSRHSNRTTTAPPHDSVLTLGG
jgi:transglutaminase-like putative cysteine protease